MSRTMLLLISRSSKPSADKVAIELSRWGLRDTPDVWHAFLDGESAKTLQDNIRKMVKNKNTRIHVECRSGDEDAVPSWVVASTNYNPSTACLPATDAGTTTDTGTTTDGMTGIPEYASRVALLAELAGYGHDIGKATAMTQAKYLLTTPVKDKIRHEVISAWILTRMIGQQGKDLKSCWQDWTDGFRDRQFDNLIPGMLGMDALRDALLYCVMTHHRVFDGGTGDTSPRRPFLSKHVGGDDDGSTGEILCKGKTKASLSQCDITNWSPWDVVEQLIKEGTQGGSLKGCHVMAPVSRAALILADHLVSKERYPDAGKSKRDISECMANSIVCGGNKREYNQPLPWHLLQVGKRARDVSGLYFAQLPGIDEGHAERLLGTETPKKDDPYAWQHEACTFLKGPNGRGPVLVFNLAGTGAGKTLANLKCAMQLSLNLKRPFRANVLLGLRTLTLQTRDEYVGGVAGLGKENVSCVIGSPLVEKLHDVSLEDTTGTENRDDTYDHHTIAGNTEPLSLLPGWMSDGKKKMLSDLLSPPVLVSTMDHLVNAGNPNRQANHAEALLRLAGADLIIDEVDAYDPKSAMAVLRVIERAAFFGRNVIVSSATTPEVLANAIMDVWNKGIERRRAMTGDLEITGWIAALSDLVAPQWLDGDYGGYVAAMASKVGDQRVIKRAMIKAIEKKDGKKDLIDRVARSVRELGISNAKPYGGKKVSIGLVRMANVDPCMETARHLVGCFTDEGDPEVRVMTYHGREILARRWRKEVRLNKVLSRKREETDIAEWIDKDAELQKIVRESKKDHVIFVVVSTPVEEVGRDHDFDWAVVEPSSLGAVIQVCGRVNRHRKVDLGGDLVNIHILNQNFKDIDNEEKGKDKLCYVQPGHQCNLDSGLTHRNEEGRNARATELFGKEIDDPFVISIALAFGRDRCTFAKEDEDGIRYITQGAVKAMTDDSSWMNDWLPTNFPLRDKEKKRHMAAIPKINESLKKGVYSVSLVNGKFGLNPSVKDTIKDDNTNEDDNADKNDDTGNLFFSPSLEEVLEELTSVNGVDLASEESLATAFGFEVYDNVKEVIVTRLGIETTALPAQAG